MNKLNLSVMDKFLLKTFCKETHDVYYCPKHLTLFTIKKSDVRKHRCDEDYCRHAPTLYQED